MSAIKPGDLVYMAHRICYGRTRVVTVDDGGMSLRDYFAAAALQGYLASYAGCTQIIDSEKAAEQCYRYADAMLEARKK